MQDSEVQVTPNPYTYIWKYSYDADGNLAGTWFDDYFYPSNGVYDENLNPHRTNIVWMLIDRNYSVNNPLTAGNYKGALLRLHCSAAGKWNPMFVFAYTYYYAEADIA